ncbi:MAG: oligoendopeptidase F [Bacillota bacterium]|jgi:oligoendopeptidase F|nr:oligoendopeptidase F [Bacillota bacterium]
MVERKTKRLMRHEVPEELTWNLQDLFVDDKAWEAELAALEQDIATVKQYQGSLGESAKTLAACLKALETYNERLFKANAYASLLQSGDGASPANQEKAALAMALSAKVSAEFAFVQSEIAALPDELARQYLEDPALEDYIKFVNDILETKPHRLAPETEEVLAALREVHSAPEMIYQRTKAADMDFEPIQDHDGEEMPMSFALYEDLYESMPDTELRRKAAASFTKTLKRYQNTFAGTYGTEVKKQVLLSKIRRYNSVTEMLLQPQQVTEEMYHNQLDIIQKELAPHMRRYARLKKEQLGLDKMVFCDLKAQLDPENDPKITFAEARELILDALKVLGSEYLEIIAEGLYNRWVDLADNVGKSTGAFCLSIYGLHPYILLTWTDNMRSAFVLVHELGHAGHFALAMKYNNLLNLRPSTYLVEAPSTMNELLLGNHILSQTDSVQMRRWVIMQYLGTYYHNFVTHLLEGEYQRRVYAAAESGRGITASLLNQIKGDVLTEFWADAVEIDDLARLTWMRQPHYYRGLYPYTYSAGLTIATACAEMIKTEGQPAVDRWLEFLKAGGKYKPLEHVKIAGLDMSTPEPIRKAVAFVGSLVDELEKTF